MFKAVSNSESFLAQDKPLFEHVLDITLDACLLVLYKDASKFFAQFGQN